MFSHLQSLAEIMTTLLEGKGMLLFSKIPFKGLVTDLVVYIDFFFVLNI